MGDRKLLRMGAARVVKKVKAYPIPGQFLRDNVVLPIRVVKLTAMGLMCDMGGHIVRVGSRGSVSFELPVLHLPVEAHVVIVKTWDQFAVELGMGNSSLKLAEMHFQGMSPEHRDHVVKFLKAIQSGGN